jgi:hypothetical protein
MADVAAMRAIIDQLRRLSQVEVKYRIYVTNLTIARLCLVWLEYVAISKQTAHDSRRKKDPT